MNNPGQHHQAFRRYSAVIEISKHKKHQVASKQSVVDGIARRKVDDLLEERRLEREINGDF